MKMSESIWAKSHYDDTGRKATHTRRITNAKIQVSSKKIKLRFSKSFVSVEDKIPAPLPDLSQDVKAWDSDHAPLQDSEEWYRPLTAGSSN